MTTNTGTRPEIHDQTLHIDAERLRDHLESQESEADLLYWAVTAATGSIRDNLQKTVYELDAIFEVLDARGVWDDDETEAAS